MAPSRLQDGKGEASLKTGRLTGLVAGMESYFTRRLPRVTAAETEARTRPWGRSESSRLKNSS